MSNYPAQEQRIITMSESRVANVYGIARDVKIILDRHVRAPMRDGVTLATNVFRPATPGKYPVLLHLSPQGKDRIPADANYERIPNTGSIKVSEWAVFEGQDPLYWVPHGYVVIVADCRATWDSEGAHFEHVSPEMARDFYDLVEWAAAQQWSDGNVGANGVSYLAMTQWLGAALRPPHLKAMIPWEGLTDIYREWAFHGGIPDTGFYRFYMSRAGDPKMSFIRKGATFEDLVAAQKNHPLYDDFWKTKHPDLSKIDVPSYVCVIWSSTLHNRGGLEGYKQMAGGDKWLEIHGRKEWEYYYSRECLERQRRFMDCFLKGKDSGIRDLPRVRFEVRERFFEGRWRFADDFPVPGTEYRKLYLDPQGALSASPVAGASSLRYSAVKSSAEKDKAEFTITFNERTELVGYFKLRLWVSAEGAEDMDVHVGIKKVDRHGHEVHMLDFNHFETGMVAIGWQRATHRELEEKKSTPWQPWLKHERLLPLKIGEVVPLDIEILPSSCAFDKGETLKLIVQGYDILDFFYRYKHDESPNRGHHLIHSGAQYDSHLLVPVIPKETQ